MLKYEAIASDLKEKGLDIDSLQDSQGMPVDELVKPLVAVLNHRGYKTIASCQGHSLEAHKKKIKKGEGKITKETPHSFMLEKKFGELKIKVMFDQAPWADMKISSEQKAALSRLLEDYNKKSGIAWKLQDNLGMTEPSCRLSAHHEHAMEKLHSQIEELAEFIHQNTAFRL